jgi:ribonucleotide reductase beta subunit family protein with ferritin-like domain
MIYKNEQCNKLNSAAYKSCIDSYFNSKDRNDIYEYWLQLTQLKRNCEAEGVQKALELIEIYEDINAKD